jgi:hypothetical protein
MRRLNTINQGIVQRFGSEKLKKHLNGGVYLAYEKLDNEVKNSIREVLFRNQALYVLTLRKKLKLLMSRKKIPSR